MTEEIKKFKLVGAGSSDIQEKIEKPALSFMQDAWRRLKQNKLAVISLWFICLLIVFSVGSIFVVSTKSANSFNSDEVVTYRNLPPKLNDSLPFWNGSIVYSGNTEANDAYADQSVPEGENFILGTDNLGRSIAKRVTVGIRISLLIAVVATIIDLIIGVTYGLISGFSGGKTDTIMMRIVDIIYSVPMTIYVILIMITFEKGGFRGDYNKSG